MRQPFYCFHFALAIVFFTGSVHTAPPDLSSAQIALADIQHLVNAQLKTGLRGETEKETKEMIDKFWDYVENILEIKRIIYPDSEGGRDLAPLIGNNSGRLKFHFPSSSESNDHIRGLCEQERSLVISSDVRRLQRLYREKTGLLRCIVALKKDLNLRKSLHQYKSHK